MNNKAKYFGRCLSFYTCSASARTRQYSRASRVTVDDKTVAALQASELQVQVVVMTFPSVLVCLVQPSLRAARLCEPIHILTVLVMTCLP